MKQLITLFIVITGYFSANAQKDSVYVWNKWCERKDTLVLFKAANNMICVYSQGFKAGDVYLKSLDKTLKISTPEVVGDTLTTLAMPYTTEKPIRLAIVNKKNNKPISTVLFYGADIPAPRARMGYLKDSIVPKVNILAQVSMRVYFPNSLYSYPYHIKQFSFKTKYEKSDFNCTIKGHLISKDIEQAISGAPSGTIIEFYDIKATCPECVTRDIENLRVRIK